MRPAREGRENPMALPDFGRFRHASMRPAREGRENTEGERRCRRISARFNEARP